VPFSKQALIATLERLRREWDNYQSSRNRDGIYRYLSLIFEVVILWAHERKAAEYAKQALRLQRPPVPKISCPFAALIYCSADRERVDYRTRSKWSRLLRYAKVFKDPETLIELVRSRGGINKVAARYARYFGRKAAKAVDCVRVPFRQYCK